MFARFVALLSILIVRLLALLFPSCASFHTSIVHVLQDLPSNSVPCPMELPTGGISARPTQSVESVPLLTLLGPGSLTNF